MIAVNSLAGVGRIPNHRTSASRWLRRHGVPTSWRSGKGGRIEVVSLADLPEPERRAYLERDLAACRLEPGAYDDAAHAAFAAAPPSLRAKAERRAAIVRLLLSVRERAGWPERIRLVRERFGVKGTSKKTLKEYLKAVDGVDPINFAPALLPGYRPTSARAEISEEAWRFFLTTLRDAGPSFPLKAAWRDVRDVAEARGWAWPSYATVHRRWEALPEAQRLAARHGREEAARRLAQPALRDKTTLAPLEIVSLDGRTLDFWAALPDGAVRRPTMLALVDVASGFVIGWTLSASENAVATLRTIRGACERHGIMDRIYTDNGSAFAGHLVAGGNVHKWRGTRAAGAGVRPLGICAILGIDLTFALPGNAQAKIAERTFATLSRSIDDRPEFRGAHAGHAPGASRSAEVEPVPLAVAEEVIRREVARHNAEAGRRAQGAGGRSYQQVFEDGLRDRPVRRPTQRQLYLAGLEYKPASVDRHSRVQVAGWTYGGPETRDALKEWHKRGQVLIGRDPYDFAAPALAYAPNGDLICEGIEPVRAGAYDSADGAREAARYRKAARKAVAEAEEANAYLEDAAFRRLLAELPTPDGPHPAGGTVVGGAFGGPLRAREVAEAETDFDTSPIPEEHRRNRDAAIEAMLEAKRKRAWGA